MQCHSSKNRCGCSEITILGIQYSLIFDAVNTTINTFTDIKLTLCSAFLNPDIADDESHYIYIDNIPGILQHRETTSCTVEFEPAEYIRNDMTCFEEQRLSFSSQSNYIPQCQAGNTSLYDGCQCSIEDSLTLGQCSCVDDRGNQLPNKLAYFEGNTPWQKVCVEDLQCDNSKIEYNGHDLYKGISCVQAQETAVLESNINVPRCQDDNITHFDGCQCYEMELGTQCRCVDIITGNMIPNKFINLENGDSWQRVCVQELKCAKSNVTYIDPSNTLTGSAANHIGYNIIDDDWMDYPQNNIKTEERPINDISNFAKDGVKYDKPFELMQSIAITLFALMSVIFMACYMMKYAMIPKWRTEPNDSEHYDEERVPIKQDMD